METILQTGVSNALVAAVLALVAVLVGYFYRRPALVHGLWLLVLLKLLTPPLVTIPITWGTPPLAEPVADVPVEEPNDNEVSLVVLPGTQVEPDDLPRFVLQAAPEPVPAEPVPAPLAVAAAPKPFPWLTLLGGVWLAGSTAWFLLAGWRVLRFRRLLRFAVPAPEALRRTAERLAHQMKLPACPTVQLIPGRLAPMLWSLGRPLLLVPRELLLHLTPAQQETLLAHELAHLRRRDHWVRGLEFLALGLYWWHPVVWYARRELREAEEQCCDAWVVSLLPGAGKTYASALLETLEFLSDARPAVPLLASGIGHVSDLKRRLTMIMCATTPRALSWRGTLAVLALGLFALPLLPTLANAQTDAIQQDVERQLAQARAEEQKARDTIRSQAELEQAHAELAKLQAAVKSKQDQIRALEVKLAALKGGKAEQPQSLIIRLRDGDKKEATEIVLRKVGDKWEVVQPKKPGAAEFHLQFDNDSFRILPAEPNKAPGGRPQPGKTPVEVKPNTLYWKLGPAAPESRIDNLEHQLQQILKELETLRKEMKQPKPGSGTGSTGQATPDMEKLRLDQLQLERLIRQVVGESDPRIRVAPPTAAPTPALVPKPESR